jgi:hypothetical protein
VSLKIAKLLSDLDKKIESFGDEFLNIIKENVSNVTKIVLVPFVHFQILWQYITGVYF